MLIKIDDERSRQRSYSAPKKIRLVPQTVQTDLVPEHDNDETQSSESGHEQDKESEIADVEEGDDDKQKEEDDDEQEDEQGQGPGKDNTVPEVGTSDHGERFRWHTVSVNGRDKILDLKLLESYMKVISHGGTVRIQM